MSNTLFPLTKQQFFANNGTPLAGGLVYTYVAGTSTPQASYTASGATNTNPVVLDYRGSCDLWGGPNAPYKINVTDASGNQISGYPIDNVAIPPGASSGTFTATGQGFASTQTFVCSYTITGNQVTVSIAAGTNISNATFFRLTGVPQVLQPPTLQQWCSFPFAQDNSANVYPGLLVIDDLTSTWEVGFQTGVTWTASGFKGLPTNIVCSYLLI